MLCLVKPLLLRSKDRNSMFVTFDIHADALIGDTIPDIPDTIKCLYCGKVAYLKNTLDPKYFNVGDTSHPLLFKTTVEQEFEYLCLCELKEASWQNDLCFGSQ